MRSLGLATLAGVALAILLAAGDPTYGQSAPRVYPAGGTWQAASGESGVWRASLYVDDDGMVSGIASTGSIGSPYFAVEGTVIDDRIAFTYVNDSIAPAIRWTFEGTILGVRLAGTLASSRGLQGEWEGWWNSVLPDSLEPTLRASAITGRRGSRVTFAVELDTAFRSIGGVQNDIINDLATPIATCAVDEQLGKDLFYRIADDRTRFLVLSLSDATALPTRHVLYRCEVEIAADARIGVHPVRLTDAAGSDPLGNPKDVAAVAGAIRVVAVHASGLNFLPDADWDTDAPGAGGGSAGAGSDSDGCAIDAGATGDGWLILLTGAIVLYAAHWRRR